MPARRPSAVGPDGSPLESEGGKEKLTFGCPFPDCGQTYSRMEYLKRHQRKHQDERPFQCKDCSKAFARSDVLLRHRRRCHPTPPPPDRSSHSPLPPLRAHPSVPISSSRTSEREASPTRDGRKHPRQSSGSTHDERGRQRLRLSPSDDEDDDRYGSRFSRNGMGNGGVFGVTNYYDGNPVSSEPNYAPNLLPMFQNSNGQYHNMHDPNHLEDASVLLSMAYPGGVPSANPKPTIAGQQVVPDWEGGQTINMMMDATTSTTNATASAGDEEVDSSHPSFSSGVAEDPARPAAPGAVLPESMGNYAGTMNWLASATSMKDVDGSASWPLTTVPSPRPLSPFPLSSLFSPSTFGLSLAPSPGSLISNETTAAAIAAVAATINADEAVNEITYSDSLSQTNQVVASILDQLALNDVPQTKANPNPERPLLRLAHWDLLRRAGEEMNKGSRFYLPADRFAGCYQIPHWALPPLRTLSVMASRTFHTVLNHFSFVHTPTFKLIDTAACLAFAICTVGGIRTGKPSRGDLPPGTFQRITGPINVDPTGPLPTGNGWESVFAQNWGSASDPEQLEHNRRVEEWEGGQVVRHEKTNMLVKSFSLAQGVLMTEYNVALLQALILYHAPYFLSQDEHERRHANMFLGTIVNITRQIGFFLSELEHADLTIQLPKEPFTPNELDRAWKNWIQMESRRRTAYLVYQLDTISALESSIPCIMTPCEISYLPLPAPDSLWKAETADEWFRAVKTYRPMNLDEAMRRIFFLPTYGSFDEIHEKADTQFYNLLNESDYGPFARVAMIITLLRGIMDIGEGKRDRGDWRDLTDLWIGCTWLRPGPKCLASDGKDLGPVTLESLRGRFALGLQRWRQGWDFDSLCLSPTSTTPASTLLATPQGISMSYTSPESVTTGSLSGSMGDDGDGRLKSKLVYCEEALPFYWLAQALLNILNNSPIANAGYNAFSNVQYNEMLSSARAFTRMGEGVTMGTMF